MLFWAHGPASASDSIMRRHYRRLESDRPRHHTGRRVGPRIWLHGPPLDSTRVPWKDTGCSSTVRAGWPVAV